MSEKTETPKPRCIKCNEPFVWQKAVYRCADCDGEFCKPCLRKHFAVSMTTQPPAQDEMGLSEKQGSISDKNPPAQDVESLFSRFRFPGMASDLRRCFEQVLQRVNNPQDYIPESVADAKHDVELFTTLAAQAGEVEKAQRLARVNHWALGEALKERDSLNQQLAQVKAELDAAKKLTSEASIAHVIETKAQR